mmetsp:Transcript_16092/g.27178  ORF Transcript_16092/g.27178 Transcript_16092/m.27178 type:complete len:164 (-) Transcript_16092:201-692(-)
MSGASKKPPSQPSLQPPTQPQQLSEMDQISQMSMASSMQLNPQSIMSQSQSTMPPPSTQQRYQEQQENPHDIENFNDIYFLYSPLGVALQETIEEMELDETMAELIKQKFNQELQGEFSAIDSSKHGSYHSGVVSGGNSNKYKIDGESCTYQICNDSYFFNTG